VAGIAMGLVLKDSSQYSVLTDILGEEDHLGDMDFKVAGTRNGITAFQMDIKIDSITFEIMEKALHQAREARLFILDRMAETLAKPRPELSEFAPKMKVLMIDKEKIGMVVGSGGKVIKEIIARTNTDISINDDGMVHVSGMDLKDVDEAISIISDIVMDVKPGEVYEGEVVRIMTFGAFVSLPGSKDGLVHISKLSDRRVNRVEDVVRIGQRVKVKVTEIDEKGRVNLTMVGIE
jgi:polyribonucleotide nucleotidyltransferase